MSNRVRHFKNGTFTSTFLPEISIRLPEAFIYIGQTAFILHQVAQVDRHHFLDVDSNGDVQRIVILHFESFLPNTDQTFNYKIPDPPHLAGPDYRFSATKIRIGAQEYIHNTWFFSSDANIQENPGGDLTRTAQLFKEHGYTLPEELKMSRYVRVVGAERKSELILFYMEPLERTGYTAMDFVKGGRGEAIFDHLSAELTLRSDMVFSKVITG